MKSLTEAENSQPEWWLNHYKQSVKYLVVRIYQLLNSEDTDKLEAMLTATLPAFADSVGVDLDEVKIS